MSIPPRLPDFQRSGSTGAGQMVQRQVRVLVVDDHELVRRALAEMIGAEPDMECCGAFSSTTVEQHEIALRHPDIVVLGVSLHHGAGLELLQQTRASNPRVRIVALAMYQQATDVERIFEAGAEACVRKMELAPRVLDAIRRTHEGSLSANSTVKLQGDPAGTARLPLSATEAQIVELIGQGVPSRAIAVRLGLSVQTVEAHRREIRSKLNVPTATHLVEFCVRWVKQPGCDDPLFRR